MRIERGGKVYLVSRYLDEPCLIEELLSEGRRRSSYILLKPLNAQVRRGGITLRLGVPTTSIVTENSLSCKEPDLILEEDVWAEAKQVIESDGIRTLGGFITKEVQVLNRTRSDSQEGFLCDVFDSTNTLELNEYLNRSINTRHVLIADSLKSLQTSSVRGYLRSYWTTHFILAGLELPDDEVSVRNYVSIEGIPKLRLLLKPLLSVDGHTLVGELPINRSVVIDGILDDTHRDFFLEVLIRAILYTC